MTDAVPPNAGEAGSPIDPPPTGSDGAVPAASDTDPAFDDLAAPLVSPDELSAVSELPQPAPVAEPAWDRSAVPEPGRPRSRRGLRGLIRWRATDSG